MATDDFDWRKRIMVEPDVRFGRPCVRDTRISVYDILDWIAAGMTFDEIYEDFTELTHEDIRAACAYAADRLDPSTSEADRSVPHRQQPVSAPPQAIA